MKNIMLSVVLLMTSYHGMAYPLMKVLQKQYPKNVYFLFEPVPFYPLPIATCGLGSAIFKRDSWLSTTFASATNVMFSTYAPYTTTTGASGCQGPTALVENRPLENFVNENMALIAKDASHGSGEYIDTLSDLLKIPKESKGQFKTLVQRNFRLLFPSKSVTSKEFLDNLAWITSSSDIEMPLARNLQWQDFQLF